MVGSVEFVSSPIINKYWGLVTMKEDEEKDKRIGKIKTCKGKK